MEWIILFIFDTVLLLILAVIIVVLILYRHENQRKQISVIKGEVLKLRFRRIYSLAIMSILNFSIFIHYGVYILSELIAGNKPGLCFDNGFAGIFGIIMSTIILAILFMISVPNLTILTQFLRYEINRTVILIEEERVLEVVTKDQKIIIRNSDIDNLEFHLKKTFGRLDERLDFIKITTKENSSIIITDLLTPINGFSAINSVYKGVKRTYIEKYYNKINCA